jgi:drug/metabolite transporter (DMT)-like permease
MSGRTALLIMIVVVAGTAGELAVSHAMQQIGGPPNLLSRKVLAQLAGAFKGKWIWLGLTLMAVAFFSFLALLSREAVSFAVPATASNYVIGALGAKFLLREHVNRTRWAGVLLVCAGVALACLG